MLIMLSDDHLGRDIKHNDWMAAMATLWEPRPQLLFLQFCNSITSNYLLNLLALCLHPCVAAVRLSDSCQPNIIIASVWA